MGDEQEQYEKAYEGLHGKKPVIRRSGSWLAIGDGPNWMALKCRRSDLPSMTKQLEFRIAQKEIDDE